jgi:hypothetical protein
MRCYTRHGCLNLELSLALPSQIGLLSEGLDPACSSLDPTFEHAGFDSHFPIRITPISGCLRGMRLFTVTLTPYRT